jgi:hypothetical protein
MVPDGEIVRWVLSCQFVPPGRESMAGQPDQGNKKPLKTEGRYAFSCSA